MEVLTQEHLRDQAGRVIRASILAGDLVPGQIYSAVTLAESLGVSPTPVREAMLDLANVGLVEPVRNRGFRVLTIADDDLDEISELRRMLELPAVQKVVEVATDEELAGLDEKVTAIESAAAGGDVTGFLVADRDFHLSLLALARNARLVRLVGQLRDQTRLVGLKPLAAKGDLMASAREHRPILMAIRARDGDRAHQLMGAHLEHTRGIWAGRDNEERSDH
jgi:DNA-binding GntR family transcriptional regulator